MLGNTFSTQVHVLDQAVLITEISFIQESGVSKESGVLLFTTTENIASNNDGDTTTKEATQQYYEIDTSLKRNNNLE